MATTTKRNKPAGPSREAETPTEQAKPEQPEPKKEPLPESEWPIPPGGGSYDLDVVTGELTLRAEPPPLKETEE